MIAAATVPRWWAQRIGDQVHGSMTQGVLAGLFCGFVFTLLPIIVVAVVLRWRRTWKAILIAVAAALILALPNLMTLAIVLGRSDAAHAGERIFDVEAPAFRNASLAGALLAVAAALFVAYLIASRRRARSSARRAELALLETKAAATGPAATAGSTAPAAPEDSASPTTPEAGAADRSAD
jgi:glucan phosphoethanolaminetransferase (alkaline phosphatase superfamily)